jgi:hypothetical protein
VQSSPSLAESIRTRRLGSLSRSRGNDHVVNGSVENLILNFRQTKFVVCAGIAATVNKPSSFERRTFILLGDVKFIALQLLRRDIGLDVGEYIRQVARLFYVLYIWPCRPVPALMTVQGRRKRKPIASTRLRNTTSAFY